MDLENKWLILTLYNQKIEIFFIFVINVVTIVIVFLAVNKSCQNKQQQKILKLGN